MDDKHEYFEKHGRNLVTNTYATSGYSYCVTYEGAFSGIYYAPSPNTRTYINCSYCASVNIFKGENLNCRQCAAPLDLKKIYVR